MVRGWEEPFLKGWKPSPSHTSLVNINKRHFSTVFPCLHMLLQLKSRLGQVQKALKKLSSKYSAIAKRAGRDENKPLPSAERACASAEAGNSKGRARERRIISEEQGNLVTVLQFK